MGYPLKSISKAGIPEAIVKAELYRYLNEPEETESICRDILAVEPGHQLALRMLGLSLTDQFIGAASDRYIEVQSLFQGLRDPYEQLYYTLRPFVEEAMRCFEEAEKIRPAGNDDSILRWNRCVRLLESRDDFHFERALGAMDAEDMPPINSTTRRAGRLN
jgi:hypothetical protein